MDSVKFKQRRTAADYIIAGFARRAIRIPDGSCFLCDVQWPISAYESWYMVHR
jgi:hypothetical protein